MSASVAAALSLGSRLHGGSGRGSPPKEGTVSIAAVVGGAVGGAVLLLAVLAAVLLYRRHARRRTAAATPEAAGTEVDPLPGDSEPSAPVKTPAVSRPESQQSSAKPSRSKGDVAPSQQMPPPLIPVAAKGQKVRNKEVAGSSTMARTLSLQFHHQQQQQQQLQHSMDPAMVVTVPHTYYAPSRLAVAPACVAPPCYEQPTTSGYNPLVVPPVFVVTMVQPIPNQQQEREIPPVYSVAYDGGAIACVNSNTRVVQGPQS